MFDTQFRSDSALNFVGKGWKRCFNLGPPRSHSVLHNRSDSLAYLRYADSTYATKWWHRWRRQLQHKEQFRLGKPRFRVVVRDSDVSAQEEGCCRLGGFGVCFIVMSLTFFHVYPDPCGRWFDLMLRIFSRRCRYVTYRVNSETRTHTHMKEKHGSCRGVYHLSL